MTATRLLAAAACALLTLPAMAQTTVKDPWVRGTVAQQKATGAFFQITNATGGTLLSASSPAAGVVEIHQMTMDGTTMKMRALPKGLDLPAGKTVELKPGGYHVMLMDLKAPLKTGDSVDISLVVEGKDGKKETIALKAPVKALGAAAADGHGGHGGHKH
ncbi:MAG: copper chaperone PCu(A)C [Aquabacterium sp.]|nr:copper chaperone PCu(A)C [Aquabacterium sp.]